MALELLSEGWAGWPPASSPAGAASPRISFSRDLDSPTFDHHHHQRSDSSLLDSSSPDFDFCVSRDRPEQDSSIADELFSHGFLLPLPLLQRGGTPSALHSLPINTTIPTATLASSGSGPLNPPPHSSLPTPQAHDYSGDVLKEITEEPSNGTADEKPVVGKQPSSFWRFGRSSSLNCGGSSGGGGGSGRRSTLICSFPLLSRSKSTGSNPSPAPIKQRHQPSNSTTSRSSTATAIAAGGGGSSSSKLSRKGSGNGGAGAKNPYYYGHHHGGGGGGVRISPVLNVPPPYIPKGSGAGLFSFGHLLCHGRDRSRKKTQQPSTWP